MNVRINCGHINTDLPTAVHLGTGIDDKSERNDLFSRYLEFRDYHYKRRGLPAGIDDFDERSSHFAAVSGGEVVGSMRLIYGDRLPAASAFPEVETGPKDIEVSRLAVEMGRSSLHSLRALFSAGLYWSINNGHGPNVFGVVERSLEKTLHAIEVPVERVADYRLFPEYNNTQNAGIKVGLGGLRGVVRRWER